MFQGSAVVSQDLCWDVNDDARTNDMLDGTSISMSTSCMEDKERVIPDVKLREAVSSGCTTISTKVKLTTAAAVAIISYSLYM